MRAEHQTWRAIKQRCRPDREYGLRGITICEKWAKSYEAFFAEMGSKPSPAHTIDRIDNARGYEPGNCRWATKREQARNTTVNRRVTIDGETKLLCEWAELSGVSYSRIRDRLRAGWAPKQAVFQKPDPRLGGFKSTFNWDLFSMEAP